MGSPNSSKEIVFLFLNKIKLICMNEIDSDFSKKKKLSNEEIS